MQVEDLTHQSRLLKVELERTSRQLKEKSATAQQEAEKNKASQEVIRSLTAQLKDMAERAAEQPTADRKAARNKRRKSGRSSASRYSSHNIQSEDYYSFPVIPGKERSWLTQKLLLHKPVN
ncbi:hypothetical protein Pint_15223 [Pistacia integerrima]|uniref:Uncharacterized protein n=1 Tax=Pistacia integerrima TaxID=434235 RepID=A0ACC0ZGB1_9ROSI|nr:hypothetical protein Pint_15223 [Pistacia integerrima]